MRILIVLGLLLLPLWPADLHAVVKKANRAPAQAANSKPDKLRAPVTIRWERISTDGHVEHVTARLSPTLAVLARNTSVFTPPSPKPSVLGLSVATPNERTRSWMAIANLTLQRAELTRRLSPNLARKVAGLAKKGDGGSNPHAIRVLINGKLVTDNLTRDSNLFRILTDIQAWTGWTPKDEVSVSWPDGRTSPLVVSSIRKAVEPPTDCRPFGRSATRCVIKGYGLAYLKR